MNDVGPVIIPSCWAVVAVKMREAEYDVMKRSLSIYFGEKFDPEQMFKVPVVIDGSVPAGSIYLEIRPRLKAA